MRTAQEALILIPDITGFTEFVNNTDIEHSQHIIAELLELLIDANQLNLEVSEIEGDAVLFYRFGKPPGIEEVVEQGKKMFIDFHEHLRRYAQDRICNCGACASADRLTIKVIVHSGHITTLR
ncbi:MAG: DUF2652 domain-containing protein, partial [Bacteroidetes bacterium]|nr:DUF2652 domain-containing protein [Bacteroidota bacterium]